jgi:endonuclease/exonuclease/phosphatase family metal-dependent hydrolase
MKKTLRVIGTIIILIVTILYILCSVAVYFSAKDFPFLTIASILYLPVLAGYLFLMIACFFTRRRTAILLLLILFAGYKSFFSTVALNVFASSWKWEKDPNTLRVMTWNVNRLGNPYDNKQLGVTHPNEEMLSYIREAQPDILCLQDVADKEDMDRDNELVHCIQLLQQAGDFSAFLYAYFYEYRTATDSGRLGVAIFSRFPVTDTGSILTQGHINKERAAYIQVMYNGRPLRIYTAHLSSMSLWPSNEEESGYKYLEGDSTKTKAREIYSKIKRFGEYHSREAEVIKRFVNASPCPVIFCADLNSVPSSHVYSHIKAGLHDAFLENGLGTGGTYNRIFPKLRIDVLLHSGELEALQLKRPAIGLSDHYPLIADIKWKE